MRCKCIDTDMADRESQRGDAGLEARKAVDDGSANGFGAREYGFRPGDIGFDGAPKKIAGIVEELAP